MTGRRAALASLNPIERDRHAPLRGDHVRPPLQQRRWQPGRDLAGEARQLRRRWPPRPTGSGRAGARALESPAHVPARAGAGRRDRSPTLGARDEHILLIADADARSLAGQADELLARANGLACRLDLQPGLGGEEPALGHERRNRLSRVLEIRLRRRGLRGARRPAVAHAAPEIELPGRGEHAALEARAVAGQLAAAAREDIDRRVQLRPGQLGVELRLLDTRRAHAQVGVVRDGLGDRRRQLIVVERREPVVGDGAGAGAWRRPLRRRLQRRAAPAP